jgi:hypothetical protein
MKLREQNERAASSVEEGKGFCRYNICKKTVIVYNMNAGVGLRILRVEMRQGKNRINFYSICWGLVIVFLLSPPLAFSYHLATSCNFLCPKSKQIEKQGPCGHQFLISKEKAMESGIVYFLETGLENCPDGLMGRTFFPFSSAILGNPNSEPLRC